MENAVSDLIFPLFFHPIFGVLSVISINSKVDGQFSSDTEKPYSHLKG
jgi:hypothetical protein